MYMETGKEGVLLFNRVIRVSLMKVKYKETSKGYEVFPGKENSQYISCKYVQVSQCS